MAITDPAALEWWSEHSPSRELQLYGGHRIDLVDNVAVDIFHTPELEELTFLGGSLKFAVALLGTDGSVRGWVGSAKWFAARNGPGGSSLAFGTITQDTDHVNQGLFTITTAATVVSPVVTFTFKATISLAPAAEYYVTYEVDQRTGPFVIIG